MVNLTLPTDSEERKRTPMLSGLLNYFPAALAGVAQISFAGNEKHNPGQPLHHARGKSMDHGDCIIRHTLDLEDLKAWLSRADRKATPAEYYSGIVRQMIEEARQRAWRALADLQELEEKYRGVPLAPGARLPEQQPVVLPDGIIPPPIVFNPNPQQVSVDGLKIRAGGLSAYELSAVCGALVAQTREADLRERVNRAAVGRPVIEQYRAGEPVVQNEEERRVADMHRRVAETDSALEPMDEKYGNGY